MDNGIHSSSRRGFDELLKPRHPARYRKLFDILQVPRDGNPPGRSGFDVG